MPTYAQICKTKYAQNAVLKHAHEYAVYMHIYALNAQVCIAA